MPAPSEFETPHLQIKRLIRESQERLRQSRADREAFKARMAGIETTSTHAAPPGDRDLLEAILATVTRIEGRLAER